MPRLVPPPGPGLYLHITQLHAQIQLAVSLSPIDVGRQHLVLHGHTAQSAETLGLRLAVSGSARPAGAERRPQTPALPRASSRQARAAPRSRAAPAQ